MKSNAIKMNLGMLDWFDNNTQEKILKTLLNCCACSENEDAFRQYFMDDMI